MRIYSASFENVSVSAIQDLFELNVAADTVVHLLGLRLVNHSDFGDAEEEILRIRFMLGATTSGSGGSSVTPTPLDPGDAAFSGTAEANNTTVATGGTPVLKMMTGWNVRQPGDLWLPIPEGRVVVPGQGRLAVHMPAAPADALSVSGELVFGEVG